MTIFKQVSYSVQWQSAHLQQIWLLYFPGLKWTMGREFKSSPNYCVQDSNDTTLGAKFKSRLYSQHPVSKHRILFEMIELERKHFTCGLIFNPEPACISYQLHSVLSSPPHAWSTPAFMLFLLWLEPNFLQEEKLYLLSTITPKFLVLGFYIEVHTQNLKFYAINLAYI